MLAVNEDEVKNVRLVYYILMGGRIMAELAAILAGLGWEIGLWKMYGRTNARWSTSTVSSVMRNERYCGDVLVRKTWKPNFHDHRLRKDRGKKNKYYQ